VTIARRPMRGAAARRQSGAGSRGWPELARSLVIARADARGARREA
jgi:hypothetical protein